MFTIAPPKNFIASTYEILPPAQLYTRTQTRVKLGTARDAKTSIVVSETVHTSMQYPKWYTKLGHQIIRNSFVNSIHGWTDFTMGNVL